LHYTYQYAQCLSPQTSHNTAGKNPVAVPLAETCRDLLRTGTARTWPGDRGLKIYRSAGV
jgi:hypothetical protein